MIKTKQCYKCKKRRLRKFFHQNKNSKDGLYSYCRVCKKAHDKIYVSKNRGKVLENKRLYYQKNKKTIAEQKKEYQNKNANKRRIYKRQYEKERKRKDPTYKLIQNYRNRICKALKGVGTKSQTTLTLLGCSIFEFYIHIENQFQKGMTWSNQGKWHIDHIMPLSSADTLEEKIRLFHYTNCQPLWAKDNLSKSDKIIF
jgi:hypothetical protein